MEAICLSAKSKFWKKGGNTDEMSNNKSKE